MNSVIKTDLLDLDRNKLIRISKPLFFGYIFLSGVLIHNGSNYAGTMFGLAVLTSLTFISAAIAEGMNTKWRRFLDIISMTTLLFSILFGSYLSLAMSMGMMGI